MPIPRLGGSHSPSNVTFSALAAMRSSRSNVDSSELKDYLKTQKGLRPGSIRSYRDTFEALPRSCRGHLPTTDYAVAPCRPVLRTGPGLPAHDRNRAQNHRVSTRNQRLAALHTFYRYLAVHHPEMLAEAERVEAIPSKRTSPPQTHYLERDEIEDLFHTLPKRGAMTLRDRALFMVLYNTGARVQEVADLSVADVDLDGLFIDGRGQGIAIDRFFQNE